MTVTVSGEKTLADRIDAVLPQTQCTRCGYPDCRAYADAVAERGVAINRCPPGGAWTIERLATITARPRAALDPTCGCEAPRRVALVDETWCIGCTLCLQACPVDAIIGAAKRMHTVIEALCTGCELCVAPCPVDCIELLPARVGPRTAAQWQDESAADARSRYLARNRRRDATAVARAAARRRRSQARRAEESPRRREVIAAAVARVRARRDGEAQR